MGTIDSNNVADTNKSELRRLVTAEKFEIAFRKFMERAEANAISGLSRGTKIPYGFEDKHFFDGAGFWQQFGYGRASEAPHFNWFVVSIYYVVKSKMIVLGIEEDRFPMLDLIDVNRLGLVRIGRKTVDVVSYYQATKDTVDFKRLHDCFIDVSEEVQRLWRGGTELPSHKARHKEPLNIVPTPYDPNEELQYQLEVSNSSFDNIEEEYIPVPVKPSLPIATTSTSVFPRDKNVALIALKRANYKCEFNPNHETFKRKSNGLPYTEPHHLIPISQQNLFPDASLDVPANIVSLCSHCHNCIHYGQESPFLLQTLFEDRQDELRLAGIDLSLDDLLKMYT